MDNLSDKENLIVEVAGIRHYCTIKDFRPKYNGDDEVLEFNIVAYPLREELI